MSEKPDIVSVMKNSGIELKCFGKELVGACPFHDDAHPSLYVNREKGVFLCRACGEGGDVIAFVMKRQGVSFKEALKMLNVDRGPMPTLKDFLRRGEEIKRKKWVQTAAARFREAIRKRDQHLHFLAMVKNPDGDTRKFITTERERARREIELLSVFEEDLLDPKLAKEMFENSYVHALLRQLGDQ